MDSLRALPHEPYPYMHLIDMIYAEGEIGPSRMGNLKQITNVVLQIPDVSEICKMPYNTSRNENQEFIARYIESTINGLPESYMLELAPKNAKDLEQLSMSYGEILKVSNNKDWTKVRSNSKRQIRMLYNEETAQHEIPPCTMGFQFNSINGYLDMNIFSRSIDIYYGLTNDIVVFFAIHEIVAQRNNLIPRKFMMSFGNLHFYLEKGADIFRWIKYYYSEQTKCQCHIFNREVRKYFDLPRCHEDCADGKHEIFENSQHMPCAMCGKPRHYRETRDWQAQSELGKICNSCLSDNSVDDYDI